jgi:hypothetical protein
VKGKQKPFFSKKNNSTDTKDKKKWSVRQTRNREQGYQADENNSTDNSSDYTTTDSESSDDEFVEYANLSNEIRTIPYPY